MSQRTLNWRHQVAADALLRLAPRSILDIGCGSGWLLEQCRNRVELAVGVESQAELLDDLAGRGLAVVRADASRLPFADRTFDLVVLRNVLHHVMHPAAALTEAVRVSRNALMITEPWFDASIASQRLGQQIEDWTRQLERRAGRIHAANLSAGEILDHLQLAPSAVDVSFHLRLEVRPLDEWLVRVHDLLPTAAHDPAYAGLRRIEAQLARGAASAEGAMVMILRR